MKKKAVAAVQAAVAFADASPPPPANLAKVKIRIEGCTARKFL